MLARALSDDSDDNKWLWDLVTKINTIRNRIAHDLVYENLEEAISEMYLIAGDRVSIDV